MPSDIKIGTKKTGNEDEGYIVMHEVLRKLNGDYEPVTAILFHSEQDALNWIRANLKQDC